MIGIHMKCITKTRKFFCLLIAHLLFLQPVLLGAGSSKSTSAQSRMARIRSNRAPKNIQKPVALPAVVSTPQPVAVTVPLEKDEVNASENPQVRSTITRKEHKSSFEKSVDTYIKKIQNSYGLKEASVKPFVDAIHKINSFQKNPNNDILSHVKKSIEPLKQVASGNQVVTKSEAQQQLGMALLLKAALPLGMQTHEIICEMLHKIDNYISYWREQKHHPLSYYFHKNPQKWFSSQKQKHEIEHNLDFLRTVRHDHLRLLAQLAEHESLFNQTASLKDQYEWIAKYLSLISRICHGTQVKIDGIAADESLRFEKLRTLISDMLSKAPAHERNVMRTLGGAKKPGLLVRNWIAYTGLAIGSVALAWYAYTHNNQFHNWMNDVKVGAARNWDSLTGNMHALYDAFMGKDAAQPAAAPQQGQVAPQGAVQANNAAAPVGNYGDLRRDLDGRLVELRERVQRVRGELNNAVQNLRANNPQNAITQAEALAQCQAAVAGYQQTRNQLINDGLVPAQAAHNINDVRFADLKPAIQRVLNSAFADIAHVTAQVNVPHAGVQLPPAPAGIAAAPNGIPAGFIRNRIGEPLAGDIDNHLAQIHHFMQNHLPQIRAILDNEVPAYQRSLPAVAALSAHTMNLVNVYLLLYQMEGGNLVGVGADIIGQLGNLIETVEHTVEPLRIGVARGIELAEKGDQIITQNTVTAILAALVPAAVVIGGAGFGASKLYKAFKNKPDFQPMREALNDIGHLLNEEGIEKRADQAQLDEGMILYLVWKLKREEENVPALLREQYLDDVSKLGISDLDTDKKRVWTAEKKLRVIDLMYRKYDFLNPMYVVQ